MVGAGGKGPESSLTWLSRRTLSLAVVVVLDVVCLVAVAKGDPGVAGEPRERRWKQDQQGLAPDARSIGRAIEEQVKDASYEVTVHNYPEVVILRGQVDTEPTRREILEVARSMTSKPVVDEMRLRPALGDDQIANEVRAGLEREFPAHAQALQVEVREGVVHLSGDLRSHRDVDAVLATTLMQQGVKDIESDLTVGGRPYYRRSMRGR
jgi:osmotically-inducible protein OsmY